MPQKARHTDIERVDARVREQFHVVNVR
jgi:hypothetical protein